MKSTMDKMEGLSRKLKIVIPADMVQTAFNKMYQGIQRNAHIKGFRKGKAPLTQIKSMYADKVREDVLNQLINESYNNALSEHSLEPVNHPKIDFNNLSEDQVFEYSAEFEVRPDVDVKKYEGLKIERERLDISADRIDKVISNILKNQSELAPVLEDRASQNGDSVDIDFEGFVDGVSLPGAKAEGHQLELGSHSFIEGFEEGLVGMKVDSEKELNLKFPEDYHNKEIAGKSVLFKVKLNKLMKKVLPELNDEFAQKIGPYKTVDELKDAIKKDMAESEEKRIKGQVKESVLKALVKENPVMVPATLLKSQKQQLIDDVEKRMKQQGLGEGEFLDYKQKWDNDFNETASYMIQASFLIDSLSEKLKLSATEADVENKLQEYAKETGIELSRLKEFYGDAKKRTNLRYQITEERVVDYLIDKAQVKEVEPKKED